MRKNTDTQEKRRQLVKMLYESGISMAWIADWIGINVRTVCSDVLRDKMVAFQGKKKKEIWVNVLGKYVSLFNSEDVLQKEVSLLMAEWLNISRMDGTFKILDGVALFLNHPQISDQEKGLLDLIWMLRGKVDVKHPAKEVWEEYLERELFHKKKVTPGCTYYDFLGYESGPKNLEELISGFYQFWANTQRQNIGADWTDNRHVSEVFDEMLGTLEFRRDEQVLRKLFGIGCKSCSQKETAKELGINSPQRIVPIKKRALSQLRFSPEKRKLEKLYYLPEKAVDPEKVIAALRAEVAELKRDINCSKEKIVQKEIFESLCYRSIEELELSIRSLNCCRNNDINLIGELVQCTEVQLLKMKNFGRKSLHEIKAILAEKGLALGMKIEHWPDEETFREM